MKSFLHWWLKYSYLTALMATFLLLGCGSGGGGSGSKAVLEDFLGSVEENATAGTVIGIIKILDSGNSPITKMTLKGNGHATFDVSLTGVLQVAAGASLDYSIQHEYILTAVASNGAGESNPAKVNIRVLKTATPPPPSSDLLTFRATVPSNTPADEFVCIIFDDGKPGIKMDNAGTDIWSTDLNQSNLTSTRYKYCRNCECDAADEHFSGTHWRVLASHPTNPVTDTVAEWRWWTPTLVSKTIQTDAYETTKPPDMNVSPEFMAGVMTNDWWKHAWLESVDTTHQKMVDRLNAKWVQYAPIPEITRLYPTPEINMTGANGTEDADMIHIIQSAHAKGLKVFLNPSPWSFTEDNSSDDHNQTWWNAFRDAWRPIMKHYAHMAEDNGVEMIEFKMWPNIDAINASEKAKMNTLASDLLTEVKNIYHGKIAVQAICYDSTKPLLDVHKNGDYIATNIWSYYPWHLGNSKDDNVTQIFQRVEDKMDNFLLPCSVNATKPMIIEQLSSASYDGAIVGACDNEEGIDSFHEDNASWTLDLQEQADVYEAVMHAMSKRQWIIGNFAFTYFFWDSIGKDINIRGKPVEDVLKKWYEWMVP